MKRISLVFSFFCLAFLWTACSDNTTAASNETKETNVKSVSLRETANRVIYCLQQKDMAGLSAYIGTKESVLVSPYSFIDTATAMRLSANDWRDFFVDTSNVNWGVYDGSGLPIELSCADYFKTFIYNQSFAEADSVIENKSIQRGNSLDNLSTVFPGNEHVEYYVAGDAKQAGLGWGSLTLVFRKEGSAYFLVGIVNNRWTI